MGIFDKIKNAIWGADEAAPAAEPLKPAAPVSASAAPASNPTPIPSATPSAPSPSGAIDITPILDAAVKKSGQKLDWRKSIVDLMKALDLDSSLTARKELAAELHYSGDTNDSATMNVWLHKALMKKLAENGGKVPADLAD
ncbi:DUF3597 domain-containing protein [Neorhizobium galegae]|uniref:DUF3597 domain-containing protein n=1 Tax=Neorhizobium galegae TaxID=399 RepID=UPI000622379B|nr:DUF3597 domain-containing protein [Neorhizobium galegae]KAB1124622.1 DUF3597 domain-containing protein [Neorhizobium galegae]MCQ1575005.1 DUF3597 domain-containing protein [Neorhizobium galegae]MCQ1810479.1 DUF3597 domain-containing protein [Neorhizobium galegae]CDZ63019.1 Hypothetical protein NGAL_HAMBI2566_53520 [Neorhizobium galegae bv. orientalis]